MLHQVKTDQIKVGMYIRSMDCSWLSSPFWRRRFLVTSAADIDALRTSGVVSVMIDDARGIGPAGAPLRNVSSVEPQPGPDADPPRQATPGRRRAAAVSEAERARATIERSRIAVMRMFHEARMGQAVQMEIVGPLVDDIAASVERDAGAMLKVTRLKNKNEYTYLHSIAVCALMINLARRLGLPEGDARRIGMAGLLHDIGKMAVPDSILDKPGALDDAEFRAIRSHPEQGHALLADSRNIDALALDVCLHHHERIDGRGYPFGKKAEEISIYARMGAICDVYDAVTSNRPYKDAWSPNEALAKMREWDGHFDPDILEAFIDSIGIPPLHSLVRLESNRLAVVIAASCDDPTMPPVRVFYSIPDQSFVPLTDVATAPGGDPIARTERADYWFGPEGADVMRRVRDGLAPTQIDFHPARPYVAIDDRRRPSNRVVREALQANGAGR